MDRISRLRRKFPIARLIRRALKITPMQRVLRKVEVRGVRPSELEALDIFGGTGAMHTVDYASRVASLEVWELNPAYEAALRRNLPRAEIKITDSFQELKQTSKKYSLIVADNPIGIFGPRDEYCEHFDLFPDILRVASDSSLLILVAIPKINAAAIRQYPYLLNSLHRQRRMDFYQTSHPDNVSHEAMIAVYQGLLSTNGFELEWYFFEKRTFIYSLVLKIRKT